ncbi:MAG: AraC family transcriptional regulator [Oricola sp.]
MENELPSIALVADVALRGGAAGICLLVTAMLLSIRPLRAATVFGVLFALGAGIYAMTEVEAVRAALGPVYVPLKLLAMWSPAFFWLFIQALFHDEFEWKPWMAAPLVAIALLYLACIPLPQVTTASKVAHVAVVTALMVHILRMTRCNLDDDLVAARRQFTRIVAVLVPLVCLAIGIIEVYELFSLHNSFGRYVVSAVLFAVTTAFGFGIAGIRRSLLPAPETVARQPIVPNSAADRFDLARLEQLMGEGVYLNSGLTIGELASRMNMPEHRLRRLINKGLGYRNFAAFINDHRIEEAKRRLAEPETARDQITSLAFDLGYASLAPFNRAFRERIGMSPSQFREKALTGA